MTSFSVKFGVADIFAQPEGMIIAIKDAFQAMYNGQLVAADVSWISEHKQESEFILSPTTLKKIRPIDISASDHQYGGCLFNRQAVKIYEARDFESTDME